MEINKEEYRNLLEEAVSKLEELKISVFTSIINLGMVGVYPEIHACMDEGDAYDFEPAMFSETGDVNLDILLTALEALSDAKESLMNLNGITPDEE